LIEGVDMAVRTRLNLLRFESVIGQVLKKSCTKVCTSDGSENAGDENPWRD
jgi:hypothetical protein